MQQRNEEFTDLFEVEKLVLSDFLDKGNNGFEVQSNLYPESERISHIDPSMIQRLPTDEQTHRSLIEIVHLNESTWSPNPGPEDDSPRQEASHIVSKVSLQSKWQSVLKDQLNNAVKLGLDKHFSMRVKAEGSVADKPEYISIEMSKKLHRPSDSSRSRVSSLM